MLVATQAHYQLILAALASDGFKELTSLPHPPSSLTDVKIHNLVSYQGKQKQENKTTSHIPIGSPRDNLWGEKQQGMFICTSMQSLDRARLSAAP